MIWVVGNRGMLGRTLEAELRRTGLSYCASDLEVDVTDRAQIERYVADKEIYWIVNCAAYTAVDRAESEPAMAFAINEKGAENVAMIARSRRARLIHLSTDYVFNGRRKKPYTEKDRPNPTNVYGRSKLAGEMRVRGTWENHIILRTAWLYDRYGSNFVLTMLRLFEEKRVIRVVNDQWGSPTYGADLADTIVEIISRDDVPFGTYHFTNEGTTTWFSFAKEIYNRALSHRLCRLHDRAFIPITTEEYPTDARRPRYSTLSKTKIKKTLHRDIRTWELALDSCLTGIRKERLKIDA
jgi:dTDP-4-dehydrorhamnose reductase